MKKEELETTIEHYVEKLHNIEQKISDLCKEKRSIMDELVLHHCPFKLGDYVSVTRKRNDTKIVSYGVIKFIKYNYEKEKFLYGVYRINKQTKVCSGGQIFVGNTEIMEKYE